MGCMLCHYIKDDGKVCGSVALRGKRYCYFHIEQQKRERRKARLRRRLREMAANKKLTRYAMNIMLSTLSE